MYPETIYQLALLDVPTIGHVHAKALIDHFGSASAVFHAAKNELERIDGIGEARATSICRFTGFSKAEDEFEFATRYGIKIIFLTDPEYPQRLLNCYDPPAVLFYKGAASLNHRRIVAVVGTRNNTEYGKSVTEKLVKMLADANCIVVSGLAFGIDAIAHKAAVKHDVPTVGVVGHGLDIIYPYEHVSLAKQMLKNGGLLTEFRSKTKPDKHNFPSRNRVVAGISDATIIVESGIKGGSMITANMAHGYNRDVFAVPGRTIDAKSSGCNELIRTNKAALLSDPEQVAEMMGWLDKNRHSRVIQKELFTTLDETEQKIVEYLVNKEVAGIEELSMSLSLSSSTLAASLLNLEMAGLVRSVPGKRFAITDR